MNSHINCFGIVILQVCRTMVKSVLVSKSEISLNKNLGLTNQQENGGSNNLHITIGETYDTTSNNSIGTGTGDHKTHQDCSSFSSDSFLTSFAAQQLEHSDIGYKVPNLQEQRLRSSSVSDETTFCSQTTFATSSTTTDTVELSILETFTQAVLSQISLSVDKNIKIMTTSFNSNYDDGDNEPYSKKRRLVTDTKDAEEVDYSHLNQSADIITHCPS